MDISIKIGNYTIKQNIGFLFCEVLMFYVLIPTRGRIFGITFGANLVLLVCFIGQFLVSKKLTRDIPRYCILYILISVFCTLVHFSDGSIVNNIIAIIKLIAPFYVIVIGIQNMDQFERLLKFIVKIFTVYSVFGIMETFIHFNIFDVITGTKVVYEHANTLRFGLARNRGLADISINNGMLLCLVLCVAAYVLIYSSKKDRKWYQISYILIFIDAFLTLSRAIWLELLITQILIFIVLAPKSKLKVIGKIITIGAVGALLLVCISPELLEKIGVVFTGMFSSTYDAITGAETSEATDMSYGVGHRFALWAWVWEKAQGHLIFGASASNPFIYISPSGFVKESIEVMWLFKLYNTGFVGLLGYIIFQIGSIKCMLRGNQLEKEVFKDKKVTFNYVMLTATVLYFITQFSCSAFEDLKFYYIILALLFCYNRMCRGKYKEMAKQWKSED